jgi:hypothetical protein
MLSKQHVMAIFAIISVDYFSVFFSRKSEIVKVFPADPCFCIKFNTIYSFYVDKKL